MRYALLAAIVLLCSCATDEEIAKQQLAYFGPACKKQGYTTRQDIEKCVDRKVRENAYFWATTPMPTPDGGSVRTVVPVPPEPPKPNS